MINVFENINIYSQLQQITTCQKNLPESDSLNQMKIFSYRRSVVLKIVEVDFVDVVTNKTA